MKTGARELGKQKLEDYYRPMSHRDCRQMILSGMREGAWAQAGLRQAERKEQSYRTVLVRARQRSCTNQICVHAEQISFKE